VDSLTPRQGDEEMAYYNNITGVVRGKWYRIPEPNGNPLLQAQIPETEERSEGKVIQAPKELGNIAYRDTIVGHSGRFSLDLSELRQNSSVQFVEVTSMKGDLT
jgi:hypothetical protein